MGINGRLAKDIERMIDGANVIDSTPTARPRRRGRATRRKPGEMNKTEEKYAEHLETRRLAGEVQEYHFDAVKLRLAEKCFYTPDFMVVLADGVVQFHEVKGFWEDDARVKIKVAAKAYPFPFIAASPLPKKRGGGWEYEDF